MSPDCCIGIETQLVNSPLIFTSLAIVSNDMVVSWTSGALTSN